MKVGIETDWKGERAYDPTLEATGGEPAVSEMQCSYCNGPGNQIEGCCCDDHARIMQLEGEIARLQGALEWYARASNWKIIPAYGRSAAEIDNGDEARGALAASPDAQAPTPSRMSEREELAAIIWRAMQDAMGQPISIEQAFQYAESYLADGPTRETGPVDDDTGRRLTAQYLDMSPLTADDIAETALQFPEQFPAYRQISDSLQLTPPFHLSNEDEDEPAVCDANGEELAFIYARDESQQRDIARIEFLVKAANLYLNATPRMQTSDALEIMQHHFGQDAEYQRLLQEARTEEDDRAIQEGLKRMQRATDAFASGVAEGVRPPRIQEIETRQARREQIRFAMDHIPAIGYLVTELSSEAWAYAIRLLSELVAEDYGIEEHLFAGDRMTREEREAHYRGLVESIRQHFEHEEHIPRRGRPQEDLVEARPRSQTVEDTEATRTPFVWPEDGSLEMEVAYRRYEDMSPDGWMSLYVQEDGDVTLTVYQGTQGSRDGRLATVEFCTYAGGGRSLNTRDALLRLIQAIQKDNAEQPQHEKEATERPGGGRNG